MTTAAFGIAGLIVLAIIADRLARAAEDRGWIYYRKRQAQSGTISGAVFGPMFDLAQPSRQIIIEQLVHEELLREDSGQGEGSDDGAWPRFPAG